MGYSAKDITERFQWTFPIVFSPTDPKVLYVGSQHVWKTTNEGQSWERISPDLTRHDPATMGPSGGPITLDQTGVETYATVFTIAPSPHDGQTIWAGSDDGLVHVTRDGGKTWDNVTPKDLPEFARISLIEASPHKAGHGVRGGEPLPARRPRAVRLQDRRLRQDVDEDRDGHSRRPTSPARFARTGERPGLLYLGTEHGIYVSFDDGGAWQSLRLDLPVTPVHGIVSTENDLVIGTHGRSFYILDNAAILRQFTPGIAAESRPPVRSARRDAVGRPGRAGGLLPEERGREGHHRHPRRAGPGCQQLRGRGPEGRREARRRRRPTRRASARRPPGCR